MTVVNPSPRLWEPLVPHTRPNPVGFQALYGERIEQLADLLQCGAALHGCDADAVRHALKALGECAALMDHSLTAPRIDA